MKKELTGATDIAKALEVSGGMPPGMMTNFGSDQAPDMMSNHGIQRKIVEARERGTLKRIGRNKPCPCESGMKFKHCCLIRK